MADESYFSKLTLGQQERLLEEAQTILKEIGKRLKEIEEMKEHEVPLTDVGKTLKDEINRIFPED